LGLFGRLFVCRGVATERIFFYEENVVFCAYILLYKSWEHINKGWVSFGAYCNSYIGGGTSVLFKLGKR